jgi:hypothetical protein
MKGWAQCVSTGTTRHALLPPLSKNGLWPEQSSKRGAGGEFRELPIPLQPFAGIFNTQFTGFFIGTYCHGPVFHFLV